ncbi:MAG TPA: FHA domain-containing protein [Anaeromyxobacteraceae bacterium]|nr:FHA domain-containing protein [Anaeromyxobacteraceae bacterium]
MLECFHCGGKLDVTMAECPTCGAEVEMGRLTGILGLVCRNCDAYNEPGTKACISCGQPLSPARPGGSPPRAPAAPGSPAPASKVTPAFEALSVPALSDLPPLDLSLPPSEPAAAPPPAPPPAPPTPGPNGWDDLDLEPLPARAAPVPPGRAPVPAAARAERPERTDETQPIPLVAACPHCGEESGGGAWCVRCGQPIGAAHTRPMAAQPPAPGQRTPSQVFGPAEPGKATLVLERGSGFEGAVFRLSGPEVGAGRSQGVVLFPDDGSLAPLHATFFYREGHLYLRDEGSSGGTYLRLRGLSVPLRGGDFFAVGDRLLRFGGLLAPAPPPPSDGTRRLGSPRPTGLAVVVEERLEGGSTGRVWIRPAPSVTLGRAGCSINLGDDPFLSQAHAEILVEPDGVAKLRDLGSSNGTFVRIPPRSERELRDGDVLRMGREVLRVVSGPG